MDHYLRPLLDHKKLIAVVAGLVTVIGLVATLVLPSRYQASASVLLSPISGDPLAGVQSDSKVDMATELQIATSKIVVGMVADDLASQSISIGPEELGNHVTATSPADSRILEITFEGETPELAQIGANTFANTYLTYRAQIAAENRSAAVAALDERITLLKENLAEVNSELSRTAEGTQPYVALTVERDSIQSELAAQQQALADLSTLSIEAGEVIDPARLPSAPRGLSLVSVLVGSILGGLVLGCITALLVSAIKASNAPRNRRATDRIEHNRRQEDRLPRGGRRATDRLPDPAAGHPVPAAASGRAIEETSQPGPQDEIAEARSADPEANPEPPPHPASKRPEPQPVSPPSPTRQPAADAEPAPPTKPGRRPAANPEPVAPPSPTVAEVAPVAQPARPAFEEPPPPPRNPKKLKKAAKVGTPPAPPAPPPVDATTSEPSLDGVPPAPTQAIGESVPPPPPPPRNRAKNTKRRQAEPRITTAATGNGAPPAPPATPADTADVGIPPEPKPEPVEPFDLSVHADFRQVADRIRQARPNDPITCLTVGERGRHEALAVSFGLADALQSMGANVLIVDALLDEPLMADLLDLPPVPGLSEVLVGQDSLDGVAQGLADVKRLDAVTAGRVTPLAKSALSTERLRDVLRDAKRQYYATLVIAGTITDAGMITRTGDELDGIVIGTEQDVGEAASPNLLSELSSLPAPTWDRISVFASMASSSGETAAATSM